MKKIIPLLTAAILIFTGINYDFVKGLNAFPARKEMKERLSKVNSIRTNNVTYINSEIKDELTYKALLNKYSKNDLEKIIEKNGKELNHTYYKDGFSVLKGDYRDYMSDIFYRLDEFILDKIIKEQIGLSPITLSTTNTNQDFGTNIHNGNISPKLSDMSKEEKSEIVAKHYMDRWGIHIRENSRIINYTNNRLSYVDPIRVSYPQFRIIWGEPERYKLFLTPGAPPENLEKEIIHNFKRVFVVSKKEKELLLYEGGKFIERQPIACGRNPDDRQAFKDLATPEGVFVLGIREPCDKKLYNLGYGSHRINILIRTLWGYSLPIIYFHGTRDPDSIGQNASEGCVRTFNEVIKRYYRNHRFASSIMIIKNSRDHENRFLKFEEPKFTRDFMEVGYAKKYVFRCINPDAVPRLLRNEEIRVGKSKSMSSDTAPSQL